MKYWIGPTDDDEHKEDTEITAETYAQIKREWNRVVIAATLEEKFDVLLNNYADFERELLEKSLRNILYQGSTAAEHLGDIYAVNRRLLNLLMTARLYTDQACHDISLLYGKTSEQFNTLKRTIARQYEQSRAYRVMDSLRNISQHLALPIHGLQIDECTHFDRAHPADSGKGLPPHQFVISPWVNSEDLVATGGVKARVLADVAALGERFNVVPLVRESVSCFASIHKTLRAIIAPELSASWIAIQKVVDSRVGDTQSVALCSQDESNNWNEALVIFSGVIERLNFLLRKNSPDRLAAAMSLGKRWNFDSA